MLRCNDTQHAAGRYAWDAENRLVAVEPAATPVAGDVKLEFAYDYRSRRVRKLVLPWNPALNGGQGGWDDGDPVLDRRFIWDGWLLLAELDDNGDVVRKYAWGLDLSGTFQGAGGIGGLLAIHDVDDPADPSDAYGDFIVFNDGAGNVGQLIDWSSSGAVVAHYEYDPYGGLMAGSYGTYADTNPLRFSTKYFDAEVVYPDPPGQPPQADGLYYFGRRYYEPRWGRWTNRDPLRELGGANLYGYVHNAPTLNVDPLGLAARPTLDTLENTDSDRYREPDVELSVRIIEDPKNSKRVVTLVNAHDKNACCKEVKFIQLVRLAKEQPYMTYVESAWKVDEPTLRQRLKPKFKNYEFPWYPLVDEIKADFGREWSLGDTPGLPNLWDPRNWLIYSWEQDYETCAVCIEHSGRHRTWGCVIGCVRWGHRWRKPIGSEPESHIIWGNYSQAAPPSAEMLQTLEGYHLRHGKYFIRSSCARAWGEAGP